MCVRAARARVCAHTYIYIHVTKCPFGSGLVVCRYYFNAETNATSWLKPILHDESGIASRRVASHRISSRLFAIVAACTLPICRRPSG